MKNLITILTLLILASPAVFAETSAQCNENQGWDSKLKQCVMLDTAQINNAGSKQTQRANAQYDTVNNTPGGITANASVNANADYKDAYESTNANSGVNSVVTGGVNTTE